MSLWSRSAVSYTHLDVYKRQEFYKTPLAYLGLYGVSGGTNTSGGSITHYYKENDDGTITYWVDTEEGLKVAKYINQFWRDGLIDPDFQTKDLSLIHI